MKFLHLAVKANLAFLLLCGSSALAQGPSDTTDLKRERNVDKKNLRLSIREGNVEMDDAGIVRDHKHNFEEDEKLWERILKQQLSITLPPTPLEPIIETPMPTVLPIMAVDEECELMVRLLLLWLIHICNVTLTKVMVY